MKVIDLMVKEEKEVFAPYIAGFLGKNLEDTIQLQNKVENYRPTMKVMMFVIGLIISDGCYNSQNEVINLV